MPTLQLRLVRVLVGAVGAHRTQDGNIIARKGRTYSQVIVLRRSSVWYYISFFVLSDAVRSTI